MAGLSIKASLRGAKGVFAGQLKRVREPFAGRVRPLIAKRLIAGPLRDLRRGGHHDRAGGFTRWQKAHDFGDFTSAAKTLGGVGGGIGRAWEMAT